MRYKTILLLALAALVSACAVEPKRVELPVTQVVVQPAPPSEVDQLLGYAIQMRKLDARAFATQRDQQRRVFQLAQSEFNRVKLAVLLASKPVSSTTASASDDAELAMLLEPLARKINTSNVGALPVADATEIHALAALIYSMANDRKKLRDLSREAQARVLSMRRDDTREIETRALRARVDELEQKLAALKSIDRSVNRRAETQRIEPTK